MLGLSGDLSKLADELWNLYRFVFVLQRPDDNRYIHGTEFLKAMKNGAMMIMQLGSHPGEFYSQPPYCVNDGVVTELTKLFPSFTKSSDYYFLMSLEDFAILKLVLC